MSACWLGGLVAVLLLRLVPVLLAEALEASGRAEPSPPRDDWTLPASLLALALAGLPTLVGLLASGMWWALPALVAALAVLLPGPLARTVFAPRGWPRAAWWATRISVGTWRRDPAGGALFLGALALHRAPRDPEAESWLLERAARDPRPLGAAALVGHGLIAARQGDRADARALLEAARWFEPDRRPLALERALRSWRAADAAARGDWPAVVAIADAAEPGAPLPRRFVPGTELRALRAAAAHLLGRADAPSGAERERLARSAPALAALWERAAVPPASEADPLRAALRAHLDLRPGGNPAALARAWEAALAAHGAPLVARGVTLGAPRPTDLPGRLREQVVEALAEALASGIAPDAGAEPALLREACEALRDARFPRVELAAAALARRLQEGRSLPVLDEVREWSAIRAIHAEALAVAGPTDRAWLFRAVYGPLVSASVALFNERGEKEVSRAISRWLLSEAQAVGDSSAIDLMQRNLAV